MFLHDIIKIKYIREGYLPNYPPHLISDEEMCDAFLKYPEGEATSTYLITSTSQYLSMKSHKRLQIGESGGDPSEDAWQRFMKSTDVMWFKDKYPLVDPNMESEYRALVEDIVYHINEFKMSTLDDRMLPNWVYSYMLGEVLSVESNIYDLHDMLVMLGVDNIDDEFTAIAQQACYQESKAWLNKYSNIALSHRHPSLFGAPHVLKSLRLSNLELR